MGVGSRSGWRSVAPSSSPSLSATGAFGASTSMWGSISDLRDVIALARSGLLEPKVTTFKFDEIPEAFRALEDRTLEGRGVIVP